MSARDELADVMFAKYQSVEGPVTVEQVAAAVLDAGYRKPKVLSYVAVGRDGKCLRDFGLDRAAAQAFADEGTADCKTAGIDWDYRVAEIVEAAK